MPRNLLLGIFLSSSPALAAETAQLAVVGIHQSELTPQDQERAIAALIEAVEATGKANGISAGEVAAAIQGREEIILRQALLGTGNQALQNGKNFYNQALPEDAIPVLQEAIKELEEGIVGSNTTKDLWEAYVYLGTSQYAMENEVAATAAFMSAAALNPARGPNPALFPPDVVEAFQAARATLSAQKTNLVVNINGGLATVYLDGEKKGEGSITIEGVLPGRHHVMARGSGTQGYQVVEIGNTPTTPEEGDDEGPAEPPEDAEEGVEAPAASGSTEITIDLGVPMLGIGSDTPSGRSRQTASLYRTLGEHSQGVDLYLLAGVSDDLLHLQLYSPRADAFSKQVEIPYAGTADDEAVQTVPLLLNVLDKNGHLPTAATIPTSAPLDIGANSELAALLTQPRAPTVGGNNNSNAGNGDKKGKGGIIAIGTILAVGALGGGGYGTYAFLTRDKAGAGGGTVIVGPF